MKVTCDHCTRTARGLRDDLIDLGWCRVVVRASFRRSAALHSAVQRTFTGCPDHAHLAPAAAVAAIDAEQERAGRRRVLGGNNNELRTEPD